MPAHKDITDPNLHEPKGVASASSGMVYTADGSGSGDWTYPSSGWGYYQDGGSAQVVNTSDVKITNDGAGSLTDTSHLPLEIRGSGDLWDTTDDKITPIRTGDVYSIRVDFPITADSGTPTELTVSFDIGGTGSPTIVIFSRFLVVGKTPPYTISFGLPLIALTDTTTTNGVQLFAKVDAGSVTITNPSITIIRNHDGSV